MAAENIFAQFAQPVRSVADYMADYDAQDLRRQQLIGAQRQNALAALTVQQQMEASRQAQAKQNALAALLRDPNIKDPVARESAMLSDPLLMQEGMAFQKERLGNSKTIAETEKLNGEAAAKHQEVQAARRKAVTQQVAGFNTPNDAISAIDAYVANGEMPAQYAEPMKRMVMSDPKWQIKLLLGIGDPDKMAEFLRPHLVQVDNGGAISFVDTNTMTNPNGPAPIKRVATPGDLLTAETTRRGQNITDKRERDLAGGKVTYQTDGNGNLVALPERVAPGTVVRGQSVVGANGLQPIPGKDAGLNDSQSKALLFGSRMQEANRILGEMAESGVRRPGNIKSMAESLPFVGGAAGTIANATQSPKQQQVEQAQRDFVNAVLRRESGAVISPAEFESAKKQYFPQLGDSDAVIAQKARNRELATNGMLAEVPQGKRQIGSAPKPGAVLKFDAQGNLVQ